MEEIIAERDRLIAEGLLNEQGDPYTPEDLDGEALWDQWVREELGIVEAPCTP